MKARVCFVVFKIIVVIAIIFAICAFACTPLVLTAFFKASEFNPTSDWAVVIATALIYACAAPYIVSLFLLSSICSRITKAENLPAELSVRFKGIAWCAIAEIIIFIAVQLILYFVFDIFAYALTVLPSVIVVLVCLLIAAFNFVLAFIFKRLGEKKEEKLCAEGDSE